MRACVSDIIVSSVSVKLNSQNQNVAIKLCRKIITKMISFYSVMFCYIILQLYYKCN